MKIAAPTKGPRSSDALLLSALTPSGAVGPSAPRVRGEQEHVVEQGQPREHVVRLREAPGREDRGAHEGAEDLASDPRRSAPVGVVEGSEAGRLAKSA